MVSAAARWAVIAPGRRRISGLVPTSRKGERLLTCCTDCLARVVWAVTERGRRMPVDANQDITGNLVLCYEVDGLERPVSGQLVVAAPADYVGPRWLSHFATCPKASRFRRARAQRGEL
jgi:hypothetical protein